MKRVTMILVTLLFLLANVWVLPGLGSSSGAVDDPPPYKLYFPLIFHPPAISGTIKDSSDNPISDVVVYDVYGHQAVTDYTGAYTMTSTTGSNIVNALKPGFTFTPEELSLSVPPAGVTDANFVAAVSCGDIMVNGALNFDLGGWDFPEADAWGFSTGRTSTDVAHSATRSGRTGITAAMLPLPVGFLGSDSYARSQRYNIPSDADSVALGLWVYRLSTSADLNDHQYLQIRDADTNAVLTELSLGGTRVNSPVWTYFEYPLNTLTGRSIKIRVGSYNDGASGHVAMYFDDVTLIICKTGPDPAVCINQIDDGGFESGVFVADPTLGWARNLPQGAPPVFQNTILSAGAFSMRTGIPIANPNANGYSEFYQNVTIPSNVDSATLSFYVYTTSSEAAGAAAAASGQLGPQGIDQPDDPQFDAQYGYIFKADGSDDIKNLWWWWTDNHPVWRYQVHDLTEFKGQTIRILFGTFNNGVGGNTAMYFDNVVLTTCTGTSTPVGPGCYQKLGNRSFENNSSWVVPATEYPAGYTTTRHYDGSRSMRAGITNSSQNRYSYSTFYQSVTIPNSADSVNLSFKYLPKSTSSLASAMEPMVQMDLPLGVNMSNLQLEPQDSNDVQYLIITDKWGNILEWKMYEYGKNSTPWLSRTFNLKSYRGHSIRVWFGVYNNGWGGVTSMYVDDTSLVICDP